MRFLRLRAIPSELQATEPGRAKRRVGRLKSVKIHWIYRITGPVTKTSSCYLINEKEVKVKACVGYTRAEDAQSNATICRVCGGKKIDTALERQCRLVGIIPDVQVYIHEKKEHCEGIRVIRVRECGSTDDKHDSDQNSLN